MSFSSFCPPVQKNKKTSDAEEAQRSTVLFVTYCLSDDQKHLLASLADDRGEMVRTTVINIHIPNRTRRKKVGGQKMLGKAFFAQNIKICTQKLEKAFLPIYEHHWFSGALLVYSCPIPFAKFNI